MVRLVSAMGVASDGFALTVRVRRMALLRFSGRSPYGSASVSRRRPAPLLQAAQYADFAAAGREHQQVATLPVQRVRYGANHDVKIQTVGVSQVMPVDGMGAALTGHDGASPSLVGPPRTSSRVADMTSSHRVLTQLALAVQTKCQCQIGVQAAFVEFVEDHQSHALQRRIALPKRGQNALGQYLDASLARDFGGRSGYGNRRW